MIDCKHIEFPFEKFINISETASHIKEARTKITLRTGLYFHRFANLLFSHILNRFIILIRWHWALMLVAFRNYFDISRFTKCFLMLRFIYLFGIFQFNKMRLYRFTLISCQLYSMRLRNIRIGTIRTLISRRHCHELLIFGCRFWKWHDNCFMFCFNCTFGCLEIKIMAWFCITQLIWLWPLHIFG